MTKIEHENYKEYVDELTIIITNVMKKICINMEASGTDPKDMYHICLNSIMNSIFTLCGWFTIPGKEFESVEATICDLVKTLDHYKKDAAKRISAEIRFQNESIQ